MSFTGKGQSFEIYNADTINRSDQYNCKYGKWKLFGKHKTQPCFKKDQLIEEGIYKDNRKSGLWLEYYCNGNIRSKIPFIDGKPGGYCQVYYPNGKLLEEGEWKNGRYRGAYKKYDTLGILINEIKYDSLGKKPGNTLQPLDDAREPMTLKHKNAYPEILDGKQTIYNKTNQIIRDGIFKNNRFMDGKAYVYDENGILTRIAVYKNGIYVKDEILEKTKDRTPVYDDIGIPKSK